MFYELFQSLFLCIFLNLEGNKGYDFSSCFLLIRGMDFLKRIHLFILFIYFWLHWVFIAVHGLSLVVVSGRSLCCSASASHCGGLGSRHLGFSSCGTQPSVVVACGL